VGDQIPLLTEMSLSTCGCRKFQIDPLGDHFFTCTSHSGSKKAHNWVSGWLMKKFDGIVQTIIIVPLTLSPLRQLLLVRLGVYIVNLCVFYFCKFIEKLTAFLQLQEFNLRNLPVPSSTTAAWRSPHSSNPRLVTFSPRLQHYGLISISTVPP
jgi:hypothetical protein